MSTCPICHDQFEATAAGQLCPQCRAEFLAKDVYSASDLRFVGVLAGILTAAVASMPGALVGDLVGRAFDNAPRGCLIGVLVFALAGLVAGFRIGPAIVLRMEAAKRGH